MLKSFITERYLLTLLKLEDEDQLLMASPFLPLVKVLWNSFVYWHFLFESFVSRRKSVLFLVDQLMLLSSHYEIVQSHSSKDFIEISRIWFWYFQKKRSEYLQPKRHHTCNISMFSSYIYLYIYIVYKISFLNSTCCIPCVCISSFMWKLWSINWTLMYTFIFYDKTLNKYI